MKLTDEQRELIIATATKHIGDPAVRSQTEAEIRSIFAATPAVHRAAEQEPIAYWWKDLDGRSFVKRIGFEAPPHIPTSALHPLYDAPLPRASDAAAQPCGVCEVDCGGEASGYACAAQPDEFELSLASTDAYDPQSFINGAKWQQARAAAPQQVAEPTQEVARRGERADAARAEGNRSHIDGDRHDNGQ